MSYIYHLRPEPFEGSVLIPLNQMDKNSDLYKTHAKKYVGREELMDEIIPILNCKWNDVVQFSAINPQIIYDEIKKIDQEMKLSRPYYFKVHIDEIISKYAAVVFHRRAQKKDEIIPLSLGYKEQFEVPPETLNFWKEAKKKGEKLLWFPFIPHIFVKGMIETATFEVCKISEAESD